MKITLKNQIEIKTTLDNENQIIEKFTFANPKYQNALSFGRSTHGIEQYINLVEQSVDGLVAPIGILDYLLQKFNPEIIDQRREVSVTIPFAGTLRPYQETFVDDAIVAKGGVMVAATGAGKCLGINTPVLMFDGSIKRVQDILVRDKLMGADSNPRKVLSLARGTEEMYRVTPVKGDSYIVNESHILSLRLTRMKSKTLLLPDGKRIRGGEIINISVRDYLNSSKSFKHCAKGWRVGIDFERQEINQDLPPYILGVWLGDGSIGRPCITTSDSLVANEWITYAKAVGCNDVRMEFSKGNCINLFATNGNIGGKQNNVKTALYNSGVLFDKHIPHEYKSNSREIRLEVLAGIIDTDGYLSNGVYDLVFKQEKLANDIIYCTVFRACCLCIAMYKRDKVD